MLKRKRPGVKAQTGAEAKPAEGPVRPIVRLPRSGLSTGAIACGAALAALFLFSTLEARRRAPAQASIWTAQREGGPTISDPPPLRFLGGVAAIVPVAMVIPAASAGAPTPPPPQAIRAYYERANQPPPPPQPAYYPPPQPVPPSVAPQAHGSTASALVIDTTSSSNAGGSVAPAPASSAGASGGPARARSSMLANRAMTVPQGTLIPAVLETAFDSTRPGFARAIVSRDVRGFDGSKVLIPRGSSLVGEYHSDTAPGQKRATIMWTRLLRPDGATIELDSPAVDPVGRGGVRASVNNHIPARIFDTLLQSSFQIGTMLATRAATGSVIVALPTSFQNSVAPPTQTAQIPPTLKVPAGSSISIFVARDLEFGGEGRP